MEPPKVFISYSHDSDEHKKWVSDLTDKLRENNIEVMIDQTGLRLGSNLTMFIEKLRSVDRVLVVCTDNYVQRANDRKGGVGYEADIITAEIFKNLQTEKFIPIIRQSSNEEKAPIFLETRIYIDFTDDEKFDENLKKLILDIRKPLIILEPTMENKTTPSESNVPRDQLPNISQKVESASDAYKIAEEFIRTDDRFGLQQFVKRLRRNVSSSLQDWKQEFEQQERDSTEEALEAVNKAVDIISPLISTALIGVESNEERFSDQKFTLHDLFTIIDWNNSNYITWMNMPNVLQYVYHSLHGGLCLRTDQLNLALNLARENVRVTYPESQGRSMVWQTPELTGDYFRANTADLWKYSANAYQKWEWLSLVFTNDPEYRASLVAYYMALNIHELAAVIASEGQEGLDNYRLRVPLDFLSEIYETKGHATDILLRNSRLSELWKYLGVTQEQMKNSWGNWIKSCKQQFWNDYQGRYYKNDGIHRDHESLFDNL